MGGWGVGRLVLCGLFAAVCWLGGLGQKGVEWVGTFSRCRGSSTAGDIMMLTKQRPVCWPQFVR